MIIQVTITNPKFLVAEKMINVRTKKKLGRIQRKAQQGTEPGSTN